jgi:hypothetical protein
VVRTEHKVNRRGIQHEHFSPCIGDILPNRKNKRRSNRRVWGEAQLGSQCIRRKIGKSQLASFRVGEAANRGIQTRIPEEARSCKDFDAYETLNSL